MTRLERLLSGLRTALHAVIAAEVVVSLATAEWMVAFVCGLALLTVFLPLFLTRGYTVRLPIEFELAITVFAFATLFLGEAMDFYGRFFWWDKLLHVGSGVILGFVGFLLLFALLVQRRIAMSPLLLATFSFAFAMAVGALWEIFEYAVDQSFGLAMQGDLDDTIWDLIADGGGGLFAAVAGFIYMRRSRTRLGWFEYLLGRYLDHNPPRRRG